MRLDLLAPRKRRTSDPQPPAIQSQTITSISAAAPLNTAVPKIIHVGSVTARRPGQGRRAVAHGGPPAAMVRRSA